MRRLCSPRRAVRVTYPYRQNPTCGIFLGKSMLVLLGTQIDEAKTLLTSGNC